MDSTPPAAGAGGDGVVKRKRGRPPKAKTTTATAKSPSPLNNLQVRKRGRPPKLKIVSTESPPPPPPIYAAPPNKLKVKRRSSSANGVAPPPSYITNKVKRVKVNPLVPGSKRVKKIRRYELSDADEVQKEVLKFFSSGIPSSSVSLLYKGKEDLDELLSQIFTFSSPEDTSFIPTYQFLAKTGIQVANSPLLPSSQTQSQQQTDRTETLYLKLRQELAEAGAFTDFPLNEQENCRKKEIPSTQDLLNCLLAEEDSESKETMQTENTEEVVANPAEDALLGATTDVQNQGQAASHDGQENRIQGSPQTTDKDDKKSSKENDDSNSSEEEVTFLTEILNTSPSTGMSTTDATATACSNKSAIVNVVEESKESMGNELLGMAPYVDFSNPGFEDIPDSLVSGSVPVGVGDIDTNMIFDLVCNDSLDSAQRQSYLMQFSSALSTNMLQQQVVVEGSQSDAESYYSAEETTLTESEDEDKQRSTTTPVQPLLLPVLLLTDANQTTKTSPEEEMTSVPPESEASVDSPKQQIQEEQEGSLESSQQSQKVIEVFECLSKSSTSQKIAEHVLPEIGAMPELEIGETQMLPVEPEVTELDIAETEVIIQNSEQKIGENEVVIQEAVKSIGENEVMFQELEGVVAEREKVSLNWKESAEEKEANEKLRLQNGCSKPAFVVIKRLSTNWQQNKTNSDKVPPPVPCTTTRSVQEKSPSSPVAVEPALPAGPSLKYKSRKGSSAIVSPISSRRTRRSQKSPPPLQELSETYTSDPSLIFVSDPAAEPPPPPIKVKEAETASTIEPEVPVPNPPRSSSESTVITPTTSQETVKATSIITSVNHRGLRSTATTSAKPPVAVPSPKRLKKQSPPGPKSKKKQAVVAEELKEDESPQIVSGPKSKRKMTKTEKEAVGLRKSETKLEEPKTPETPESSTAEEYVPLLVPTLIRTFPDPPAVSSSSVEDDAEEYIVLPPFPPKPSKKKKKRSKVEEMKSLVPSSEEALPPPDMELLMKLMRETFKYRKTFLAQSSWDVEDGLIEFPAFRLFPVMKEEFSLHKGPTEGMMSRMAFLELKLAEGLKNAGRKTRKPPGQPKRHRVWEDALNRANHLDHNSPVTEKEKVLGMICLSFHLAENEAATKLFRLRNKAEAEMDAKDISTPILDIFESTIFEVETEMWIYADGMRCLRVPNFYQGVLTMYAMHYAFNIQYDERIKELFVYFDKMANVVPI